MGHTRLADGDFFDNATPEPNTGCWLWTRSLANGGYGTVSMGRGAFRPRAHRVAWELAHGPIPDNQCVLHKCDTPACINPDHLFLGTKRDNSVDMMRKGRHRCDPQRGEMVGGSKLTVEQVRAIRASSSTQSDLARELGVSQGAISHARTGRTWKHVGLPQ